MGIYTVPNQNAIQKQLDATLSAGATTMTLNESIEALLPNISANSPVSIVIDRIDANGVVITNGTREFITATGVSGAVLSGLTRNADGSSTDQEHAIGAIVEFIPDVLFAESIRATFDVEHNANGTHDDTVVATLTGTQTLTNKTLTSPVLTTPKITTSINDTNGNEIIKTPATASAVNEITVTNSATGNAPSISATGGDTNISLNLISKGTGVVQVNGVEIGSASTDGWTDAEETWTYASASTITVPAGATSKYGKGDRIKFTQTTVKYAVIVAVADTLLTIAVNNDYVVANAAITANYYSHQLNPIGYPHWFGYDPTYTGFSSAPTADQQYRIDGNTITIRFVASGTSNSATFNITAPVTPTTIGGGTEQFIVTVVDNSASPAQPGIIGVLHTSADLKVGINPSTRGGNAYGGFTTSGSKGVEGTVIFRF